MDISNIKTLDQAKEAIAFRLLQPVATVLVGRGYRPRKTKDPLNGFPVKLVKGAGFTAAVGVRKDRQSENLIVELKVKSNGDANQIHDALNELRVGMNRMGFRVKPVLERGNVFTVQMFVDPEDLLDSVKKNRQRIQMLALGLAKGLQQALAPAAGPKAAATTKKASDDASSQSYYKSVDAEAQELLDEAKENGATDEDSAREYASEHIHEKIDGSWWIIYTHASLAVLAHSKNDDAIFDQMGSDAFSGVTSMADVYQKAAYFAMYQDVMESFEEKLSSEEFSDPEDAE